MSLQMHQQIQNSRCLIAWCQLLMWISAVVSVALSQYSSGGIAISHCHKTQSAEWCRSVKSNVKVASISNQTISGPDSNDIPIRIYHPADAKARKQGLPILVYYHGGGFLAGDLDTHDDLCRNLGHLSAYIVIAVDYRYLWNCVHT